MISTPVAFAADAALYCPECAERLYGPDRSGRLDREGNEVWPMFGAEALDAPAHCDACGRFLPSALAEEGERVVREAISQGTAPEAWLDRWPWLAP
ncbi:conserved protein of unknown function [Candidatus Hydrogenisulfobacillus filiaventi]|uniref:Uncharacterized protein n=1 Tax=Candidatus Hydrogenisulfobacillus filiaventi TaxID=2707344 RepID=A0A6F8ZI21_9FIRM|nr:conserved protein of unknown function [Candidatus Hydrogenisulfobacillus filiaventi]